MSTAKILMLTSMFFSFLVFSGCAALIGAASCRSFH